MELFNHLTLYSSLIQVLYFGKTNKIIPNKSRDNNKGHLSMKSYNLQFSFKLIRTSVKWHDFIQLSAALTRLSGFRYLSNFEYQKIIRNMKTEWYEKIHKYAYLAEICVNTIQKILFYF